MGRGVTLRGTRFGFACRLGAITLVLLVKPAIVQNPSKSEPPQPKQGRVAATESSSDDTAILVGAGDIASCKAPEGAQATAELIEKIPGIVFAAGDLAYESGSTRDFEMCYGPTWGRFKGRTRPALGNHEYASSKAAAPYFQYWGAAAGLEGKGYYGYDLGAWHIIVLNTNCNAPGLGGCGAGSEQEQWLRKDLAEHPAACTLAYGHHALFSSGVFANVVHPANLDSQGLVF